ncbi:MULTISPECIES: GAF and ANTAR domain-containing protein [unclassified Streptomyces]|uniref:GAF and ANTAR domain-containing protein n=1 Tax=unclassified Streptomyces TaxID=2593676 RepID=UPI000DBAB020|nr:MULTISPECIES: GAF and ANTAR domain-containing protein [unclassified Streptomyces]MYT72456.1 ANTAR domain-containing protein [Streptomyces sp. SID8367]RAJ70601.1 GAF domain-containing protein [Streptomyces sp. PsTaAH-137]
MEWRDFAVDMAGMARSFLARDAVDETLDKIIDAAAKRVDGCDAAGVLVVRKKQVTTVASTSQIVDDSDRLQERLGEGPCLDASTLQHPVFRIENLATETVRWRSFAPRAHALGVGSMMGFLLYTDDHDNLGALNLYSHRPGAFDADAETAGWLLAAHAAVALSGAHEHAAMRRAVDSRHTIGEAMGILMERHHLTEDAAFDTLRRYSQEKNIKLRDVAQQLIDQGTLPEGEDGGVPGS